MRFDRVKAKNVIGLLVTNVLLNIAEAFAYLYRGDPSSAGFYITRISNFTVFLCNIVLAFFLVNFLCHLIKTNGGRDNLLARRLTYVLIGASVLLLVLSRIFGFYYDFDSENRYFRLASYWIMPVLGELTMAVLMFVTFKNWRYLKTVERIELLMFEFLPLVGMALQAFIYGVSITTAANTVSIMLVFVTYEIGYADYVIKKERMLMDEVISAFSQAIDEKDPYTGGHSGRVAKYARMIAEKLDLKPQEIEEIYEMALLHDIGKIGVPGSILTKSGKLTDDEYDVIKTHPELGGKILSKIKDKPDLLIGAEWHHERYDGKGYPDGITGENIPLPARIIGMADSYDAMTSNRSYRPYYNQDKVRQEIVENAGTQFDPKVAKIMLEIMDSDKGYLLRE